MYYTIGVLLGKPSTLRKISTLVIERTEDEHIHKLVMRQGDRYDLGALLRNRHVSLNILKKVYAELRVLQDPNHILCMVKHPNVTADFLDTLVEKGTTDELYTIATCTKVSAETLDKIAKNCQPRSDALWEEIVRNSNVSSHTLTYIAKNTVNERVLFYVLKAEKVTEETVLVIADFALKNNDLRLLYDVFLWAVKKDFTISRVLYSKLEAANYLKEDDVALCLTRGFAFTQKELLDLAELHGDRVKGEIVKNYDVTHPLLANALGVSARNVKMGAGRDVTGKSFLQLLDSCW